jgi:hypothetical protein
VRRTLAGIAIVVVAIGILSGCRSEENGSAETPASAAGPQSAELGWKEQTPAAGRALVFRVSRFAVTKSGWEADVGIENRTVVAWQLGADRVAVGQSFGVMLFASGDLDEVEQRGRDGDLPGLRPAQAFEPALPERLAPGGRWRATISAEGSLAAGRYLRVVFGPLSAEGDPPEGMTDDFVWITDHAYLLRP